VAEDLTRLRLDVSVDEADVGSVQVGQKASFTVSAFPSRRYPASVTRVSFGSTKTDNVVTYITWLEVNNTDMSLRPGMTAAATVTSTERNDVLLVPNTALRFTPAQAGAAPGAAPGGGKAPSAQQGGGGIMGQLMPRMPRPGGQGGQGGRRAGAGGPPGDDAASKMRQVWVLQDGTAQPLKVRVGISDGRMTEVTGEGIAPGMAVITDQRSSGAAR
jgi:HlyD family secretion protein